MTLMRPTSCTDYDSVSSLSSASDVKCGDYAWTTKGSLPLLVFFIVTSSIIHADEADLLKQPKGLSPQVRFSPLFTILIRSVQLACCVACMSGFDASNSLSPLIAVIIISLIPLVYSFLLPVCSVVFIAPIRIAGYVCVSWTALICAFNTSGYDIPEYSVFVGWGVIWVISVIVGLSLEEAERKRWGLLVAQSGLLETTDKLSELLSTLIIEDVSNMKGRSKLVSFQEKITKIRSTTNIANLLLDLEEVIIFHRLTSNFLSNRREWQNSLRYLRDDFEYELEEKTELSLTTTPRISLTRSNPELSESRRCKYVGCDFFGKEDQNWYCSSHYRTLVAIEAGHNVEDGNIYDHFRCKIHLFTVYLFIGLFEVNKRDQVVRAETPKEQELAKTPNRMHNFVILQNRIERLMSSIRPQLVTILVFHFAH